MDLLILNKDKRGKIHLTESELARLLMKAAPPSDMFDFYLGATITAAAILLISVGAGLTLLLT